ncbi:MAG: hypothetical protein JNK47_16210 [Mesorhizobium sp.]|nr:hypothetical protein [Mesorhizobium sp.]MBL8578767.1 hypothetical protein [Mesorhizobium sp.]
MKRIVLILLATVVVAPALAEDLPGVTKPKPIVQPVPEPEDQQAETARDAIRVGDWDVKVSGSVTVDIGVGSARIPRSRSP